jgi:lysophospholipase L1-like esterase
MLDALQALPSKPKIYLCKPVPALKDSWTISEAVITGEIVPLLEKAVKKEKLEGIIDLHTAFEGHPEMMQDDGIHPNAAGVRKMAETVARVIDPDVKIPERPVWRMR